MSGAPETESPPCVLCGGERFEPVLDGVTDRVWGRPGRFTIARCGACGLRQTRPRPTREALGAYYEGTYSAGAMREYDAGSGLGKWLHTYRLNLIRKVFRPGPAHRILDVGCAYGGFLAHAHEDAGCAGVGVDIDASVRDAPPVPGVELRQGTLADIADGPFQIVTFYESLEHLPDPIGDLRRAHALLDEDGLLVVEVPHWDSLWRVVFGRAWLPLLVPQHLVHLDMPSLRRMAEEAGFDAVYHKTMFVPTELLMSLWVALGARRAPEVPSAADRVRGGLWTLAGVVIFVAFEVPSQLLLRIADRSGTQVLIARKR